MFVSTLPTDVTHLHTIWSPNIRKNIYSSALISVRQCKKCQVVSLLLLGSFRDSVHEIVLPKG